MAEVSEKAFPVPIDGLCLDLKQPGQRPRIWINKALRHHRKRFTFAHEIGHIVIPWHTGSIVDELDADDPSMRDDYRQMEGEANRFAAELLMPKLWAVQTCQRAPHLRNAMQIIADVADVSMSAAALRTVQCGPAGYLAASVREGEVIWTSRTPGTQARPPLHGSSVGQLDMPAFYQPQVLTAGGTNYYWWQVKESVEAPSAPEKRWRDILEYMLLDIPEDQRGKAKHSINAIIGNSFGRLPKGTPVEILYQSGLASLQNRNDRDLNIITLLRHPDIREYVLARAHERSL